MYNLQTRKSLNRYKQSKVLGYKSILKLLDICEIKDSTHTIYWLTKETQKVTWAFCRQYEKKQKKNKTKQTKIVLESWNWTFYKWQY